MELPLQIFALDFDGVLVDSAGEVTASAILAAKQRWPQLFSTLGAGEEKELFQLMLQVCLLSVSPTNACAS
jgi:hypothetical protein